MYYVLYTLGFWSKEMTLKRKQNFQRRSYENEKYEEKKGR